MHHHTFKECLISELLSILTTPFAGSNPFGENINYDTDFDVVKNEIAKLGGVDFDLLEKTSLKILEKKSKDIRVMSFLSWSYLKSADWERFCDIWDGLGTLVEQNYDALFPDRDRAKQLAFKWLAEERYTSLLEEKKPTEAVYDHIARMLAGLTKIKPVLEQKFPDGSPFPSALFTSVQRWEKSCKPKPKVEAPPPPPPPPPAAAGGAAPAAPAGTAATPAPASNQAAAEPMNTPLQAQLIARKAAFFLIEKEPEKIMGYRMLRAIRWDLLENMPPVEGGKLKFEGPTQQQRSFFQKLLADKSWKLLLEKGESFFADGFNNLWLDLQRYVSIACKELGAGYSSLHFALLVETALLLRRLPELPGLIFSDGGALCDDATKDWITAEVQPALASGNAGSGGGGGGAADPVIEEQRTVNQMTSVNQVNEALAFIQKNMQTSSNERDLFRRSIMAGNLLIKAKQPDVAISMLEALDRKIDAYHLAQWDPEIAVEAWSTLVYAYKAGAVQKPQNIQAMLLEKSTASLSKIALIDPGKAFTLSTK